MAGVIRHRFADQAFGVCGLVGLSLLALVSLTGCGGQAGRSESADGPAVVVTFRGDPLGGVQVSLHDDPDRPPLARAVTGADGKAHFADVPSPEPPRYHVGLESLGDGGWMFDRKVVEPFCQTQTLDPLEQFPSQELALPDRAVRPLDPGFNR